MTRFEELVRSKTVLLLDGGLGTELDGRGCEMSGVSNLNSPDVVRSIHEDYRFAGSDILLTNTFTMNRISIESHGYKVDIKEVNRRGVELVTEAASEKCLVFGDMGPTGQLLEPYGSYTEEQFYKCFAEQALILAEAGVDGLIIETVTDLREGICALKAASDVTDLPLFLSLAFSITKNGGRTVMGSSVAGAAEAAEKYGAAAVGANCGDLDPLEMAEITALFKSVTALPLVIQPNAGKPKLVRGKTKFDMGPEDFAEGVLSCMKSGASIVGGCCGTTPAHIKVLARKIDKKIL